MIGHGQKLDPESSDDLLKRDWVRRLRNFSHNYFKNDMEKAINCLKDCYNLHKWKTIENKMEFIDFSYQMDEKTFVDVDSLGAQACSGGSCEVVF